MSDEQEPKVPSATEWSMPEPVFRTSKGRPARKDDFEDSQAEIPTEPGFTDDEPDTLVTARPADEPNNATPKTKRPGCLRLILSVFGLIGFLILLVLGLLIYFLVFYRPADTGTF